MASDRLTMRAHNKVKVFDVYKAIKLPTIYEELSTIMFIKDEVDNQICRGQ